MAGGKKAAKKLTPEEQLEQALVPVGEQPYEIPENWCWCSLLNMANIRTGKRDANYGCVDGQYYFFTCASQPIRCADYSFDCKAILLAGNGDISNISIYEGKFEAYQRTYVVEFLEPLISEYFYYYFKYRWFDYNKDKMYGTAIPYIRLKNLQQFPIPVAPLIEQRRIVVLIESLFAKLDEAREKAQAVIDSFEPRRSAVLHKAFSGELTEQWRQEHGMVLESWKRLSVSSVCNSLKYGTAKKSEKTGSVVVIRMGNLQQGEIDWSDLAYSNDKDDIEKYHLSAGDVLFNRTNSAALVGKTSIYRGEYPAIYAGYLIKLDYKHDVIIGEFLNYALNTNHAKKYCNSVKTDGVNQSNINAKKIGAYIIPVPTINEQVKIVECLQKLLKKEQQAQKAAESVIDQIDTMKKAILSRAFRGELGTNDPKEENAENLLLKIFKEKDNNDHRIKDVEKDKIDTKTSQNFKSSLEETIYQFILNNPECTLSEMKNLSGNFSDINKALLYLKQNKKIQINNSKYRVIIQDEDSLSSIQ